LPAALAVVNIFRSLFEVASSWLFGSPSAFSVNFALWGHAVLSLVMSIGCALSLVSLLWSRPSSEEMENLRATMQILVVTTVNIMFSSLWLAICIDGAPGSAPARPTRFLSQSSSRREIEDCRAQQPEVCTSIFSGGMSTHLDAPCVICLGEFTDGCAVGKLPCGHVFHKECVQEWFKNGHWKARCPMRCPVMIGSSWGASPIHEAPPDNHVLSF